MNAIGLNSSVFHGARIVGPAIAGQVIATWGTGYCFLANGLSYAAVIAALLAMRLPATPEVPAHSGGWDHALEGFRVAARTRGIAALLGLTLVVGVFGWSYVVLLPVFARDVFQVGPDGYGLLMSATGVGSVVGALGVASLREVRDGRLLVVGATLLFAAAALGFTSLTDPRLAPLFLAPMGMGLAAFFSSTNTLIQAGVEDAVRGRVMGVYALVFGTMMPLGAMLAGGLAEVLGAPATVRLGAGVCIAAAAGAWLWVPRGLRR
jgi:predicted MFS family arabinose efflux permease